jgi:hypothetical protein
MNNLEFEITDHGYIPNVVMEGQDFLIPQNHMIEIYYHPSLFKLWRVDKAKNLVRKLMSYGKNTRNKSQEQIAKAHKI